MINTQQGKQSCVATSMAMPSTLPPKLASRVLRTESGCWLWQGEMNRNGYGRIWLQGKRVMAHRAIYESLRGAISDGLVLDHLCRCRQCCNPAHLEPVTVRENTLRGEAVLFQAKNNTTTRVSHHG